MDKVLEIGDVVVRPGEVKKGSIPIIELPDGTWVCHHFIAINGEKSGPTLYIQASEHGTEIAGIQSMHMVAKAVKPSELKGSITLFMPANPFAFQHCQYHTMQDDTQITWDYPDPRGRQNQRLQDNLLKYALKSDAVINVHANPMVGWKVPFSIPIPYVGYSRQYAKDEETINKAADMAKAFGVTVIESRPGALRPTVELSKPAGVSNNCMAKGIPAMLFEVGDGKHLDTDYGTGCGARGIRNVMKHLGMIGGAIEKQTDAKVIQELCYSGGMLSTDHGGFVHFEVEPSEKKIPKGTIVCRITDIFGAEVEVHKMPEDGYMWAWILALHGAYQLVNAGDNLAYYCVPAK